MNNRQKGFTVIRTRLRPNLESVQGFTLIKTMLKQNFVSVKGFTLIEVLVVVFIMGIVVVVGGNMFLAVMRGASKAELTKEVKQNGDYALQVMERTIKNARSLELNSDSQICEAGMAKLKIRNYDDSTVEFGCISDATNNISRIATISGSLNYPMTNTNVSLSSGSTSCLNRLTFSCKEGSQYGGNPPEVTISFTLYQRGASSRPEEQAKADFKTTVSLRNY